MVLKPHEHGLASLWAKGVHHGWILHATLVAEGYRARVKRIETGTAQRRTLGEATGVLTWSGDARSLLCRASRHRALLYTP